MPPLKCLPSMLNARANLADRPYHEFESEDFEWNQNRRLVSCFPFYFYFYYYYYCIGSNNNSSWESILRKTFDREREREREREKTCEYHVLNIILHVTFESRTCSPVRENPWIVKAKEIFFFFFSESEQNLDMVRDSKSKIIRTSWGMLWSLSSKTKLNEKCRYFFF